MELKRKFTLMCVVVKKSEINMINPILEEDRHLASCLCCGIFHKVFKYMLII